MGAVAALAGTAVLGLVTLDMVRTVMRVETHSGPLTRALSIVLWRGARRLPRRGRRGGAPGMTGVGVTVTLVATWLLLTWLGWFLVFSATEQAVVHGDTGQPADVWSRAYFAAYAISTLGIGDYVPGGPAWQILTGVAATAGFAIATLVITYVASLTSAVADKRRVARTIYQLGTTPDQLLSRAWDGNDFATLEQLLVAFTSELNGMAEQQRTYPILYFYRATERPTAYWPSIAVLHEALFILDELVDGAVRPHPLALEPARAALHDYVDAVPDLGSRHGRAGPEPAAPRLDRLRADGVPLRPAPQIATALDANRSRRERLAHLLHEQGWAWETIDT